MDYTSLDPDTINEQLQQSAEPLPTQPPPPSFLSKFIARITAHFQKSKDEETRKKFMIPEEKARDPWGDEDVFNKKEREHPLVTNIAPKKPEVKTQKSIWSNKSPWSK